MLKARRSVRTTIAPARRAPAMNTIVSAYTLGGGGSGAKISDDGAPMTLGATATRASAGMLDAVSVPNATDVTHDAIARQHSAWLGTGFESFAGAVGVDVIDAWSCVIC